MAVTDTTEEAGRNKKSRRWFVNEAGDRSPRVSTESTGFVIEILDEAGEVAETLRADLGQFQKGVRNAAALFGLVTSITNTFGSSKLSLDDAIEAAQGRLETLQEGTWSSDRQAGPRTSDIVEAYIAYRKANDRDTPAEKVASFRADIESGKVKVPDLLKDNPGLNAEYLAIKSRRAAERAAKAREAAGGKDSGGNLLD